MKTILATLLVLFLSLPMARADSPDGKGLICHLDRDNKENSDPDTTLVKLIFIFESDSVYAPFVTKELPLRIQKRGSVPYELEMESIHWGFGLRFKYTSYKLNRKTLDLERTWFNITKVLQHNYFKCELESPRAILGIFEKEVEKLKEEMKDNKI